MMLVIVTNIIHNILLFMENLSIRW